MTEGVRPEPFLIADHRALDFLNSVGAPWGTEVEWISNGTDLLDWLERSDLIANDTAMRFRAEGTEKERNELAGQARELREWFREFVDSHAGHSLDASAADELRRLNALLSEDTCYRRIVARASDGEAGKKPCQALTWHRDRHWKKIGGVLLPIAEAIGDLVCGADFSRVKNCEDPTCTLWFLDVSKNHTRRWCSMSVCGNRAKAAAFRERQRKRQ